jgi:hypothetical protein
MVKIKKILFAVAFAVVLLLNLNMQRPDQKEGGELSLDNLVEMAQAEGEYDDTLDPWSPEPGPLNN